MIQVTVMRRRQRREIRNFRYVKSSVTSNTTFTINTAVATTPTNDDNAAPADFTIVFATMLPLTSTLSHITALVIPCLAY